MKQSELKKLVAAALKSAAKSVEVLSGNDNPQVISMKTEYQGQVKALTAVMDALNGNQVFLKILVINQ